MLVSSKHIKKEQQGPFIKSFLKNSFLDWRGRICSVIFLGGCNFRCPYCHNKDLVLRPDLLPNIPFGNILDYIKSYRDWLDGIVISGGEPCINTDLPIFCEKLRKMGIQIKLDTNGSRPKFLKQLINNGLVDYVAMDFKAPLNEFSYRRCTGIWIHVDEIGKSLDLLLNADIDYEFRATVCTNLLNIEDIISMGDRIRGAKRFVLQNFIPQNTLDPSFLDIPTCKKNELKKMQKAMSFYVQECLLVPPY